MQEEQHPDCARQQVPFEQTAVECCLKYVCQSLGDSVRDLEPRLRTVRSTRAGRGSSHTRMSILDAAPMKHPWIKRLVSFGYLAWNRGINCLSQLRTLALNVPCPPPAVGTTRNGFSVGTATHFTNFLQMDLSFLTDLSRLLASTGPNVRAP